MIYCVWYPSGGFGHFINGILTLHGKGFKRPTNKIEFSTTGDSHKFIMPVVDLPWRDSRDIDAVESMLYRKQKNYDKN